MYFVSTSAAADNKPLIILDAGHGGIDGGAVGYDNTNEKDINLLIAHKLRCILSISGFNVIMTRTDDRMTCDDNLKTIRAKKISDIKNRFKILEENPHAVFISIHLNKFHDSSQWGGQVFYSVNNPQSILLASNIQESICATLQPHNKRKIKPSGNEIYILHHAQIPAALVECGFMSNTKELELLKNDSYQTKTAVTIAEGIIKFFEKR